MECAFHYQLGITPKVWSKLRIGIGASLTSSTIVPPRKEPNKLDMNTKKTPYFNGSSSRVIADEWACRFCLISVIAIITDKGYDG